MKPRIVLIAILGVILGPAVAARADSGGGFCDDDPALCAHVEILGTATQGITSPSQRRGLSRFYWKRIDLTGARFCSRHDGRQVYLQLINRATSEVVTETFRCPDPTVHAEALPPSPPPPEAVWDQVPLPVPQVKVNPVGAGLTGLETFLWYDQPMTASLQLALDGYAVTVDARVVRLRWHTGDGSELSSTAPGSAAHPAAQHVYETKGNYTVRLDVTWSGTYRFAGPGLDPITVPLGERTFSGEAPYAVAEIRAVRQ